MNSSFLEHQQLQSLYDKGMSMADIGKRLGCSIHKVAYWMKKHNINRRTRSQALYVKLNPDGDPFLIKSSLTSEEMFLYGLGIGIYWGEGEKVSHNAVRVANTDPFVIKTFIRFLKTICQLEERKLLYSIVCFNDSDSRESLAYWAKMLAISEDKFGKIVQIPPQGKGIYKRKSQFGVCTVIVSNIKLKAWIMNEIDAIKKAWIV